MGWWRVELRGADGDLNRIASLSQSPAWKVDANDGRFFLEASGFEAMTDSESVRAFARDELLPIINGVARLRFGRMMSHRIEIGAAVNHENQQGHRTVHLYVEEGAVILATESIGVTVDGKLVSAPPPLRSIAEIGSALMHDPHVREALDFFSYDEEWAVNLNKVFEIICDDIGGSHALVKRGWSTHDDLRNFRSVHDPGVIGRQARHAIHSGPPLPDPMNEDEACAFIQRLLEEWLREKHRQLGGDSS